jgi:hypothetical protein
MDHEIDLQKAGQRILPIRKRLDRDFLPQLFGRRRFLRMPAPLRSGVSIRSIVAALTRSTCWRTSASSFKCPCLSSAPNKWGIAAFKRFPQMRSAVSQSNTSAALTASP